ncbi:hypothetical protein ACFX2I_011244 [Malus domestica]
MWGPPDRSNATCEYSHDDEIVLLLCARVRHTGPTLVFNADGYAKITQEPILVNGKHAIGGLVIINPKLLHNPITMVYFHTILDKAFGKNDHHSTPSTSRPLLVLLSQTLGVGQAILNQNEAKLAT